MKMAIPIIITIIAFIGLAIVIINMYLSFIRFSLHKALKKNEKYRWVSGIPIIGSLLLWCAAVALLLQNKTGAALILIGFSLLDTCGIFWFIGNALYHHFQPDKGKGDA
jgi:hypothetical protein